MPDQFSTRDWTVFYAPRSCGRSDIGARYDYVFTIKSNAQFSWTRNQVYNPIALIISVD